MPHQNPAPTTIDNATVLYWAWSENQPFGFVSNEDGSEKEAIYGLAICQYEGSSEVYRFSCNKNWETVQDGLYDRVEEAIERLPKQYRNVVAVWQKR